MRIFFADVFGDTARNCYQTQDFDDIDLAKATARYIFHQTGIERVHLFERLPDNSLRSILRLGYKNHPLDKVQPQS